MDSGSTQPRNQRDGLKVSNLSKRFGAVTAVGSVTIECRAGEIVGLIGPNGAGKTTLINLVTGLLEPDSGTVSLNGRNLHQLSAHEIARSGVARTFQNIRLFKGLTVRENVEVATVAAGHTSIKSRRAKAERLLEDLSLASVAGRKASTLSYGYQRRLEIARALALNPAILLLDEPAAGATEMEAGELVRIIRRVLKASDVGVLVVDHDLRFIWQLSDRVYVLDHGEVIASGLPDDIRINQRVIDVYIGTGASNSPRGIDGRT